MAGFDRSDGPLTKYLDMVLKEMNVEWQAYHEKYFIGNHVHTCCKVTYTCTFKLKKEMKTTQKQTHELPLINYAVL